jgi:hypothetical protein
VTVKERVRAEIDAETRQKLARVFGREWYRAIERTEAVVETNYLIHATSKEAARA